MVYLPTTARGACPASSCATAARSTIGSGRGSPLLRFSDADPSLLIDTAPAPLEIVVVDDWSIAPIYEAKLVLVRPDTHVAWRATCRDGTGVWARVLDG